MIAVEGKRRRRSSGQQPPAAPPSGWRALGRPLVRVAYVAAGAISYPYRRIFGRATEAEAPPSDIELYKERLNSISAQARTLSYLVQHCIATIELLVQPRYRVPPLKAARSTQMASLRVKRARHYHPGPVTSRRGVPALLAFTLISPAIILAVAFGIVRGFNHYTKGYVPPQQLALNQEVRGARIYDRNGNLLYEFVDDQAGIRLPVTLDQISPAMLAATIATEDSSFFTNPGVNPKGLVRAAWENFGPFLKKQDDQALEGSGGSSITQQLVKNVYIPEEDRQKRSLDRKLTEAAYALQITANNDKQQILQWYLNEISYGGLYNGVEAASKGYFGKPASELTLAEAALLAGIPQSPASYDPLNQPDAALARRNEVLDLIAKVGKVQIGKNAFYSPSADVITAAKAEPLQVNQPSYPIQAPQFVLNHIRPQVEALLGRNALYQDGLVVTTSLDLGLQNKVQGELEQWVGQYEQQSNSHNGAVIVMNTQGEVLVLLGSRDYYREDINGEVDNSIALNSPGSSFKPFVYLTSFMKLGWTPNTIIADTPVTYREYDGTIFQPQNPVKGSYLGNIPIKVALGNSLNVPAFKTALATGVDNIIDVAKKVGITTLSGYYGPSISIGGVDLTALDLTYAYSVLANNGAMVGVPAPIPHAADERTLDPVMILKIEDSHGNVLYDANKLRQRQQVVPADKAYMVTSILSDPQNQCVTFGCGGTSLKDRVAAVKTGTSEPFDPNGPNQGKIGETWSFGYTPDYVVGVWNGNSDNAPVVNIYSTTISFQLMRDTMATVYNGHPSGPFPLPDGSSPPVRTPTPAPTATPAKQPPVVQSTPVTQPSRDNSIPPSEQPLAIVIAPGPVGRTAVQVQGWAWSPAMQGYRLEVSPVATPGVWTVIGQSTTAVKGGTLGVWQTSSLAAGSYDIRVVVQDARVGSIVSAPVRVTVSS
jgi:membrane peptidoglycan carboxypeptidase